MHKLGAWKVQQRTTMPAEANCRWQAPPPAWPNTFHPNFTSGFGIVKNQLLEKGACRSVGNCRIANTSCVVVAAQTLSARVSHSLILCCAASRAR